MMTDNGHGPPSVTEPNMNDIANAVAEHRLAELDVGLGKLHRLDING